MRLINTKYILDLAFERTENGYELPVSDEELQRINQDLQMYFVKDGKSFWVHKDFAWIQDQSACDSLAELARSKERLWEAETDPNTKEQLLTATIRTMARSVALGAGPFGFMELASLLGSAGRPDDAIDIYKQFLQELAEWKSGEECKSGNYEILRLDLEKKADTAKRFIRGICPHCGAKIVPGIPH